MTDVAQSHLPVEAWAERPGEMSWRCTCGAHNKHIPLGRSETTAAFVCGGAEYDSVEREPMADAPELATQIEATQGCLLVSLGALATAAAIAVWGWRR